MRSALKRFRELRENLSMTVAAAAEVVHVPEATLNHIEAGQLNVTEQWLKTATLKLRDRDYRYTAERTPADTDAPKWATEVDEWEIDDVLSLTRCAWRVMGPLELAAPQRQHPDGTVTTDALEMSMISYEYTGPPTEWLDDLAQLKDDVAECVDVLRELVGTRWPGDTSASTCS